MLQFFILSLLQKITIIHLNRKTDNRLKYTEELALQSVLLLNFP